MNKEAQENIGKSIQQLIDQDKIDMVALEGAFSEIDIHRFREFEDQDAVRKVADYMLRENKISGAMHAAFMSSKKIPLYVGVDDQKLYDGHVQAYKDSVGKVDSVKKELALEESRLEENKSKIFSPPLLAFDRQVQQYRKGTMPVGEYVEALVGSRLANALSNNNENISLRAKPERLSREAGRQINLFLSALAMEKSLDFAQVEKDRGSLILKLSRELTQTQMTGLVNASLSYRLGRMRHTDFYGYLKNLCEKEGLNFKDYPAMDSYIHYVLLSDQIKAEKLLAEIKSVEDRTYDKLAKTPAEKDLIAQSRRLHLSGKLIDFSLTPEEWRDYQETSVASEIFSRGGGPAFPPPGRDKRGNSGSHREKHLRSNASFLASFEAFFEHAAQRDQAISANLLKQTHERKSKISVLVTGGYHTEGITKILAKENVAVVTLAPKITKIEGKSGTEYLSVFTQEKSPLEKLFDGDKLFVSQLTFPTRARLFMASLVAAIFDPAGGKASADAVFHALSEAGEQFKLTVQKTSKFIEVNLTGPSGAVNSRVILLDDHTLQAVPSERSMWRSIPIIIKNWLKSIEESLSQKFWNMIFQPAEGWLGYERVERINQKTVDWTPRGSWKDRLLSAMFTKNINGHISGNRGAELNDYFRPGQEVVYNSKKWTVVSCEAVELFGQTLKELRLKDGTEEIKLMASQLRLMGMVTPASESEIPLIQSAADEARRLHADMEGVPISNLPERYVNDLDQLNYFEGMCKQLLMVRDDKSDPSSEDAIPLSRDEVTFFLSLPRGKFFRVLSVNIFTREYQNFKSDLAKCESLIRIGKMLGEEIPASAVSESQTIEGMIMASISSPILRQTVKRFLANDPDTIKSRLDHVQSTADLEKTRPVFAVAPELEPEYMAWMLDPESWALASRDLGVAPINSGQLLMDAGWSKSFIVWGGVLIQAVKAFSVDHGYSSGETWETIAELVEKINNADPALASKLTPELKNEPINLLYLVTFGQIPDLKQTPIIYHGAPLENIRRMIFDSKGQVNASHSGDSAGRVENYFSFNNRISEMFTRKEGLILKFDVPSLLMSGLQFHLGKAVHEEELICDDPVPLKFLTQDSKLDLARQFITKDDSRNGHLAAALGFSDFTELKNLMERDTPASIRDAWAKRFFGANTWGYRLYTAVLVNWEAVFQAPVLLALVPGLSVIIAVPVLAAVSLASAYVFSGAHKGRTDWERQTLRRVGFVLAAALWAPAVLFLAHVNLPLIGPIDRMTHAIASGFALNFLTHGIWNAWALATGRPVASIVDHPTLTEEQQRSPARWIWEILNAFGKQPRVYKNVEITPEEFHEKSASLLTELNNLIQSLGGPRTAISADEYYDIVRFAFYAHIQNVRNKEIRLGTLWWRNIRMNIVTECAKLINLSSTDLVNAIDSGSDDRKQKSVDNLREQITEAKRLPETLESALRSEPRNSDREETHNRKELRIAIARALKTLSPRERRVFVLRFFDGRTLEEVGDRFGITRERVRQLQYGAIRRLLHPSRSRNLKPFLSVDRYSRPRGISALGLVSSLADPSPRVRESARKALRNMARSREFMNEVLAQVPTALKYLEDSRMFVQEEGLEYLNLMSEEYSYEFYEQFNGIFGSDSDGRKKVEWRMNQWKKRNEGQSPSPSTINFHWLSFVLMIVPVIGVPVGLAMIVRYVYVHTPILKLLSLYARRRLSPEKKTAKTFAFAGQYLSGNRGKSSAAFDGLVKNILSGTELSLNVVTMGKHPLGRISGKTINMEDLNALIASEIGAVNPKMSDEEKIWLVGQILMRKELDMKPLDEIMEKIGDRGKSIAVVLDPEEKEPVNFVKKFMAEAENRKIESIVILSKGLDDDQKTVITKYLSGLKIAAIFKEDAPLFRPAQKGVPASINIAVLESSLSGVSPASLFIPRRLINLAELESYKGDLFTRLVLVILNDQLKAAVVDADIIRKFQDDLRALQVLQVQA